MAKKPTNPQLLRDDILKHLQDEAIPVFHVEPEGWPDDVDIWWDTTRQPDYKTFLAVAKSAGAKMILFYEQEMTEEMLLEAEDSLEISGLEPEEFRQYSRKLAEFRNYLGFVTRVGLGFQQDGFLYWYEAESPWYADYMAMLEDLTMTGFGGMGLGEEDDEDEDEGPPRGGYFSNN